MATSRGRSPRCIAGPTSTAPRWLPRIISRRHGDSIHRRRRLRATERMPEPSSAGLHRLAVVTAGATVLVLFAGGLVTSTGSGLAVPDWPLSFGQVFPPMVGGVLFEHGHRLAATAVGCLTVVLVSWTVVGDARTSVRALGLLALLVVVLQGVL